MICDNCKRFFVADNNPSGVPNGVKMLLKDGKAITLCADCIMSVGQMTKAEKDAFFERIQGVEGGVQ